MSERGYTITRTFDAPREAVWEAWTKPEHFATWFATEAMEMRDVELDVRPGGKWHGTMVVPNGNNVEWHGSYLEVVEPERLVMDISDSTMGEEYERYSLTLVDDGDKTPITLSQTGGHLSDEEYERAREGTAAFMESLAGLLPGILKAHHDTQ